MVTRRRKVIDVNQKHLNHCILTIYRHGRRFEHLKSVIRRAATPLVLATMVAWTHTESHAQEPPARERPSITFKSGVEVVTVTAAVRDRRGRVVRDLSRDDFEVLDTGAKRTIRDFHAGDAPISLAIVLDISGSMAVGGNMDRARQAVAFAVGMLNGEHDEAALFTFDAKLQEVVTFTKDVDVIRRVSLEGRPWGITSLYDAVAATAKDAAEPVAEPSAVDVILPAPAELPSCPKCGGKMWDNRLSKRNPKAPDYKCRDRSCDGVIWPPRVAAALQGKSAPAADADSSAGAEGLDSSPLGMSANDIPF